jgi:predicted lipoprotein with Yx(FWY)xxD motif
MIGSAAITVLTAAATVGAASTSAAPLTHHEAAHAPHASGAVTVKTRHKKLGTFLVTGSGRTLYLFEKDEHGTTSHCYHGCARAWPPLLTSGAPIATGKTKAGLLGTTQRRNGAMQVTYNGHPLYRFDEDTKPGQTHGEGVHEFGAEWNVVNHKGHEIENDG